MPISRVLFLFLVLTAGGGIAAESPQPLPGAMNNDRLEQIIRRLDAEARGRSGYWVFTVEGQEVTVITDQRADRMRILVPVAAVEDLDREMLHRLMQANFDSTLDARYALARDIVWSAYIHPLRPLQDEEFLSGIGQVVNLALTYGSSYSSGALVFGGGDSAAIQRRKLIDRLIEEGLAI